MTQPSFSAWLLSQMARHAMAIVDLAARLGVNHATVSRWASGKRSPSARHCYRLAAVINANPDYILALAGHSQGPVPPSRRSLEEVQAEFLAHQPIEVLVYEGTRARDDRIVDYAYLDAARVAARRVVGSGYTALR